MSNKITSPHSAAVWLRSLRKALNSRFRISVTVRRIAKKYHIEIRGRYQPSFSNEPIVYIQMLNYQIIKRAICPEVLLGAAMLHVIDELDIKTHYQMRGLSK